MRNSQDTMPGFQPLDARGKHEPQENEDIGAFKKALRGIAMSFDKEGVPDRATVEGLMNRFRVPKEERDAWWDQQRAGAEKYRVQIEASRRQAQADEAATKAQREALDAANEQHYAAKHGDVIMTADEMRKREQEATEALNRKPPSKPIVVKNPVQFFSQEDAARVQGMIAESKAAKQAPPQAPPPEPKKGLLGRMMDRMGF